MFSVARDPIDHIGLEKTPRSTYNIPGCIGTGVLGVLRVRVREQLFFIIGDGGTWVCQTLILIILLYL